MNALVHEIKAIEPELAALGVACPATGDRRPDGADAGKRMGRRHDSIASGPPQSRSDLRRWGGGP
jgi:hypothetical protein